jgi:hypothetical protein
MIAMKNVSGEPIELESIDKHSQIVGGVYLLGFM